MGQKTQQQDDHDDDDARCGKCSEEVTYDDRGVCCDGCNKWHHAQCESINNQTYKRMQKSDDTWFCNRCKMPTNENIKLKKNLHILKVGSLNCRGMRAGESGATKRMHIAEDMRKYHLDILALQETHTGGDDPEEISTIDRKCRYMVYHSKAKEKNRAGVAIAVRKGTNVTFRAISDRVCLMKIKATDNYTMSIINAYAPTLPVSESNPEVRESFYDELESVVRSVSNRDYMIIAGDFNAKTGREWDRYPQNIGRYGKGDINSNGKELLEFCNRQNLILTNTLFRHKMAHRSTWESPANHVDGKRKNPYRNLIDYIIIRKEHRHTLDDSRAHNGLMTYTDHRLVRAKMNVPRLHIKRESKKEKVNIEKLADPITSAKYAVNVELKLMDAEDNQRTEHMSAQEQWNTIVEASHKSAKEVLGKRKRGQTENQTVRILSDQQKNIHLKINAIKEESERKELKKERNKIMKEIQSELGREKQMKIEMEIREIEEAKDDSNRMFRAVKNLQRMKTKTPLTIDSDGGVTTDPEKQTTIISEFFKSMFTDQNAKEIEHIPPAEMRLPFTEKEIKSAVKSLKNNRSPGIDEITAEHLKNGPDLVYEKIATLLNHTAATGDFPKELNCGVLIPLQKPGKKKGPPANLRPVILLSMIRKILAICLIRRIGDRVDQQIPPSQAAYRSGRGTTEQLLTIKLMAEKAATTPNYATNLLLMDMSKAFDRVERGRVIQDLKEFLQEDELHLIKILLEDVRLAVRVGKEPGNQFKTNIGIPQGDCLSPILFTLYLSRALSSNNNSEENIENHPELPPHLRDHCYSNLQRTGTLIPLQYADDICWLGMNCKHSVESVREQIPQKLAERNLLINNDKTE